MKKVKKDKSFIIGILLAGGFGLVLTGVVVSNKILKRELVQNSNSSFQTVENSEFSKTNHSVEEVAQKISPSVVSIVGTGSRSSIFGVRATQSAGTGVVVSKNGYIVTNKHVIEGKNSISVVMSNGDIYENIKIVAKDPLNDLAFLKIDGVDNLTPAELGDSKKLKVGQQVVAVGNALGQYQNTITSGIISGMNRNVEASDGSGDAESLSGMIQTDAAINSGNSGGPLVNSRGQVIGINTAKATDGDGIGFAIPISSIKGMLKSLVEKGRADRAVLGVSYHALTPTIAKSQNLPINYGAYLYSQDGQRVVASGSPAEKAGLKSGDIITEINGEKIGESGTLLSLVSEYSVGETIKLTIYRGRERLEKSLTLEAYSN
ncbi:MAG: trypsin-like peptidase domain-containing protein [bacterium]|nr:trypsin-like peptidase domain-containing protein [bacterium]